MKKLFVVLALVLAASLAFADTAQVKLISAPTGSIGPYVFNVQQSNPNYPSGNQFLVCWSDFNNININQSWTADVFNINTVPVTGPFNETANQYKEIAYLAQELIAHPGTADLQIAVWYAAGLLKGAPTAGALADFNDAVAAVTSGQYTAGNALFYLPVNSDGQFITNGPQPLVGFVPEPGSLVLLGSGILTAAGAIRRRILG